MTAAEIDLFYGQTPCLCEAVDTWHFRCFANKTKEQVNQDYDRVYKNLRRRLARERKSALARCMKPAPFTTSSRTAPHDD